jgi:signal transduction histidine kinase
VAFRTARAEPSAQEDRLGLAPATLPPQGLRVLADFVTANRNAIIEGARRRVVSRRCPKATDEELTNGIPVFLEQLVTALRLAESSDLVAHEQILQSASRHGHDLFRMGLSIAQVVHDYGDVCQTITELAANQRAPISGHEFQTLNLCLDDAIAEAVTQYARERERVIADQGTERLGMLAHELRNLLNTATLAFESIKSGRVSAGGSTGLIHSKSLIGLRDLVDRSLAEVRLDAGLQHVETIAVAELIEELEIGALLQAKTRGLHFAAKSTDPALFIDGDRALLAAVVSNFLQNAFKFTHKDGNVSLTAHGTADHVSFDVEDECGGLPPGKAEELFRPFEQRGADRGGLGLGLTICQRAARVNGGKIRVQDVPGKGCIFTLELPRTHPSERAG